MNVLVNVPALALFAVFSLFLPIGAGAQTATHRNGPVFFVENRGQWDGPGRYLARFAGLDLWVTDRSLVYDFHRTVDGRRHGHVLTMELIEAEARSSAGCSGDRGAVRHYLVGRTDDDWI